MKCSASDDKFIYSWTAERGKDDIPGLCKRGSRTRRLEERASFHIRMLLSAGTLQRCIFVFSSVTPRVTCPRLTGKTRLLSWFTGLLGLNTSYSVFLPLKDTTSERYPWLLCKALRTKQGTITSCNVWQWCCTEPFFLSSQPWTHVKKLVQTLTSLHLSLLAWTRSAWVWFHF